MKYIDVKSAKIVNRKITINFAVHPLLLFSYMPIEAVHSSVKMRYIRTFTLRSLVPKTLPLILSICRMTG